MRKILAAPHIWIALLLWGGFWLFAWAIPRSWLFDITNALTVAVGAGCVVAYWPGFRDSITRRDLSGGHMLVMGITVAWADNAVRHLYNWIWRFLGQPADLINHPTVAFLVWVLFTTGVLHLVAKDALEGRIPRENWLRLGKWTAFGVGLAALVILWLEPSPHHINSAIN